MADIDAYNDDKLIKEVLYWASIISATDVEEKK